MSWEQDERVRQSIERREKWLATEREKERDRETRRHNRKMEKLGGGKGGGCAIVFLLLASPIIGFFT